MTWQPIETAPKDGTPVIAWMHRKPRWAGDHSHESGVDIVRWTDHNGGGWVSYRMGQPTHWMPLPASPVETEAEPARETRKLSVKTFCDEEPDTWSVAVTDEAERTILWERAGVVEGDIGAAIHEAHEEIERLGGTCDCCAASGEDAAPEPEKGERASDVLKRHGGCLGSAVCALSIEGEGQVALHAEERRALLTYIDVRRAAGPDAEALRAEWRALMLIYRDTLDAAIRSVVRGVQPDLDDAREALRALFAFVERLIGLAAR